MTTATVLVRLVLSFCAFELTEYPWRRAIAKIRSFVAALTSGLSLNARDTVGFETFASRAMSSIVVRLVLRADIEILAVVVEAAIIPETWAAPQTVDAIFSKRSVHIINWVQPVAQTGIRWTGS